MTIIKEYASQELKDLNFPDWKINIWQAKGLEIVYYRVQYPGV